MRAILLAAAAVVLLGACAPGAYVIEWNAPMERAERVVERVVEVEVPVVVEVPVPVPVPEPPVVIPRPPLPRPPFVPPVPAECDVRSMPERSPWLEKIKCPGEPARLVPRP